MNKYTKQGVLNLNGRKPKAKPSIPIRVASSRGPSRGPQSNLQISYGQISGGEDRIRYVEGSQYEAGERMFSIGAVESGDAGILVFVQDMTARDNNPGRTITINPDDFSEFVDTLVKMRDRIAKEPKQP